MNRRHIGTGVGASVRGFGTLHEGQVHQSPSDELTVHLLVALDEVRK
jgi:hypothetical protein